MPDGAALDGLPADGAALDSTVTDGPGTADSKAGLADTAPDTSPGPCQSNADCDDGLLCTTDTCAGTCNNAVQVGHCVIGETCYSDGALVSNECLSCDAASGKGTVKLTNGCALLDTVVNAVNLHALGQNKFGAMVNALNIWASGTNLDLQSVIDKQIADGSLLWLLALMGQSLTSQPQARLQTHLGQDLDANPADNFTGNEPLGLAPTSPPGSLLAGSITASKIAVGPAMFTAPYPLGLDAPMVTFKNATVTADVTASGLVNGILTGAVPYTEFDTLVIPALAAWLDAVYKAPGSDTVSMHVWLDLNQNGTITTSELRSNNILKPMFAPDVDTDGDGIKDALTVGYGFTSVGCQIQYN